MVLVLLLVVPVELSAVVLLEPLLIVLFDPLVLELSALVALLPGCCTPGSVAPMVALAPVFSLLVATLLPLLVSVPVVVLEPLLVPVVALASGCGCCVPDPFAPIVALALLSVVPVALLLALVELLLSMVVVPVDEPLALVSAEVPGLGCCAPVSVGPVRALAP
jgi:hypothetical protein